MPPTTTDIMEVCQCLAMEENLQVTLKQAGKGALLTGLGAFTGAILGGPIGLAIGGSVASITAALTSRGKFKSVAEVLVNDMTYDQKAKLARSVKIALQKVDFQDIALLISFILSDASLKELIIRELANFLQNELGMYLVR